MDNLSDAEIARRMEVLARHNGNESAAARELGIARSTLQNTRAAVTRPRHASIDQQLPPILKYNQFAQTPPIPPSPTPVPPPPPRPIVRIPAGSQPTTADSQPRVVVAVGDLHDGPHIPKDRFTHIGRYCADVGATDEVWIGDAASLDSLCSYVPNDTFSGRLKGTVWQDFDSMEEALEAHEKGLAGHQPRRHITFGNHEDRIESFSERHPEIYGDLRNRLEGMYRHRGWTHSRFGAWYYIGTTGFTHVPLNRLGKAYGGKTCEQQIANDATHDIVFGHTHAKRHLTVAKLGLRSKIEIINLGCALPQGFVEPYAKLSNTGWSWGVFKITIVNGMIRDTDYISMAALEAKYGD